MPVTDEERLITQLLEQAYARLALLPEPEQDTIAALILEEIEYEEKWNQKFASSQDVLSRLAQKALAEHRAGKTLPLDPTRYEVTHYGRIP